jgi:hypothetical protein
MQRQGYSHDITLLQNGGIGATMKSVGMNDDTAIMIRMTTAKSIFLTGPS